MTKLEVAARELCRLRGIDPDKRVSYTPQADASGFCYDVMLYATAWELAALEIDKHQQIAQAIAFAS